MHDLRKNDRLSQLYLSLALISFQWFAEHAWLSLFTIFFPEYDLRHLKKKSYPDIIGFTIFSTYTQKINQGLLQNWWVKTFFERVIKLMNNSQRLTKYNFISKYLEKTAQVQKHQKLFQHIALLFEVKILAAAKPYRYSFLQTYVVSLIW